MYRNRLPIVPADILAAHAVHEPMDTRFRASARLLQAIWRRQHDWPVGSYTQAEGSVRELGSRLTDKDGLAGRNFLSPDVARLAWRETAYREIGALVDEDRLATNLLSSSALLFNCLGPLALDLDLATAVVRDLCPDLADATVTDVLFEHSPGRGDETLCGDRTSFDACIYYRTEAA